MMTSGCITSDMWHGGFTTVTITSSAGTSPGSRAPTAVKQANGDIVLDYDAVRYRAGWLGAAPSEDSQTPVRLQERASPSQLQPLTNWSLLYPGINRAVAWPASTNETGFVPVGGELPISDRRPVPGRDFEFPATECLLPGENWGWYVPPRRAGEPGQIAALAKNSVTHPVAFVPVKVVLTPVTIIFDGVRVVVFVVVAPFGLGDQH